MDKIINTKQRTKEDIAELEKELKQDTKKTEKKKKKNKTFFITILKIFNLTVFLGFLFFARSMYKKFSAQNQEMALLTEEATKDILDGIEVRKENFYSAPRKVEVKKPEVIKISPEDLEVKEEPEIKLTPEEIKIKKALGFSKPKQEKKGVEEVIKETVAKESAKVTDKQEKKVEQKEAKEAKEEKISTVKQLQDAKDEVKQKAEKEKSKSKDKPKEKAKEEVKEKTVSTKVIKTKKEAVEQLSDAKIKEIQGTFGGE